MATAMEVTAISPALKVGEYKTFKEGDASRFMSTSAQDVPWAVLFGIHLVAYAYFVRSNLQQVPTDKLQADEWSGYFPMLYVASAIALVVAAVWTMLLRMYATGILYLSLFFPFVIYGLVAVAGVLIKNMILMGVGLVCVLFHALYMWLVWDKIEFTAMLLQVTTQVMHSYVGVFAVTMGGVAVGAVYTVGSLIFVAVIKDGMERKDHPNSEAADFGMIVALMFSFYWTSQVISNTLHTTVCGVVGRWYFKALGGTSEALTRSLTKSFGSICLGSFIMAIIQTIDFILECLKDAAKDGDNIVVMVIALVLQCFVQCIKAAFEFLKTYAYVYCAIYGQPFCQAARESWDLLTGTGLSMIASYDLSGMVLFFGGVVGGGVTALCTGGIVHFHKEWKTKLTVEDNDLLPLYLGFAFVLGFCAVQVVSSPIQSGSCALFVCFAEEPEVIKEKHPELSGKIFALAEAEAEKNRPAQEEGAAPAGAAAV